MPFDRMLSYCADLAANNDRAWFHANHGRYEEARKDFHALLDQLRYVIAEGAPEIGGDILYMDPRDWTYRIARDMRFYRDRPPYNPSFRAYISGDKKSWLPIGYFLSVSPGNTLFGTGLFLEGTAEINRVRDYIAANLEDWERILTEGDLSLEGDRLKTVPRGYRPDHPAARWLAYKNWMAAFHFPDAALGSFDDFASEIARLLPRLEPFRKFLLASALSERSPGPVLPSGEKDWGW